MLSQDDLERIFWLSGSPCAGKSTISAALAKRFNWNVYHCDLWEGDQKARANPYHQPHWFIYSRLTGDNLWLMPVDLHVTMAQEAYHDQFALILADLKHCLRLDKKPLLYDGFASPRNLAPLIPSKAHVFYLIATETFRRQHYAQRPWIHAVLAKTSQPKQAWENWMQKDTRLARLLEQEVRTFEMPYQIVNGILSIPEMADHIARHFGNHRK
jgi:adenylate kinase family enzyme